MKSFDYFSRLFIIFFLEKVGNNNFFISRTKWTWMWTRLHQYFRRLWMFLSDRLRIAQQQKSLWNGLRWHSRRAKRNNFESIVSERISDEQGVLLGDSRAGKSQNHFELYALWLGRQRFLSANRLRVRRVDSLLKNARRHLEEARSFLRQQNTQHGHERREHS